MTTIHQVRSSIPSTLKGNVPAPADASPFFPQTILPNKAVASTVDPTSHSCTDQATSSSKPAALKGSNLRSAQRWAGGTMSSPKSRKFIDKIKRMDLREAEIGFLTGSCINSAEYSPAPTEWNSMPLDAPPLRRHINLRR